MISILPDIFQKVYNFIFKQSVLRGYFNCKSRIKKEDLFIKTRRLTGGMLEKILDNQQGFSL